MYVKGWSGRHRLPLVTALAALCAVLTVGAAPQGARGDDAPQCPKDGAYAMTLRALTGPSDTELRVGLTPAPGCGAVNVVDHVQIKVFDESDKLVSVKNVRDVDALAGVARLTLDRVDRGRRIEVQSQVQSGTPSNTFVLRGTATALLRPDLLVASVQAPLQTLVSRAVYCRRRGRGGEGRHRRHGSGHPRRHDRPTRGSRRRDGSPGRPCVRDVPGSRAGDS